MCLYTSTQGTYNCRSGCFRGRNIKVAIVTTAAPVTYNHYLKQHRIYATEKNVCKKLLHVKKVYIHAPYLAEYSWG